MANNESYGVMSPRVEYFLTWSLDFLPRFGNYAGCSLHSVLVWMPIKGLQQYEACVVSGIVGQVELIWVICNIMKRMYGIVRVRPGTEPSDRRTGVGPRDRIPL